jgi:glycosyltransferase involved in cell wall biosynthesis
MIRCRQLKIADLDAVADLLTRGFAYSSREVQLSGETLSTTIAEASVMVVPSEWCGNCRMSVLETMAYGKPVVATRIGCIPELVDDQVTGLLFEPEDAFELRTQLERLMGDAPRRAQMEAPEW